MKTNRNLIFLLVAVAMLALPWGEAQATYYANSPVIPKFVDPLPAIPIAQKQTNPVANDPADYYEIGGVQEHWKFSSSAALYPDPNSLGTKVRGYVQLQQGTTNYQRPYSYLGPIIVAQKGTPVRLKYTNLLPADTQNAPTAGNMPLPVDTNLMGAGMSPIKDPLTGMYLNYSQNRTVVHLHGGDTPWISDGTPHQMVTPAGESFFYNGAWQNAWTTPALTNLAKGVSQKNVPDMPSPGAGAETLYYPNGQSGRLEFYHDHGFGITRLHVYAGFAAPYLIHDTEEDKLINGPSNLSGPIPTGGSLPGNQGTTWGIPLVIQDKTFVDSPNPASDPNWLTVSAAWGGSLAGDLWFPHVYEFNQSGTFGSGAGANPQGRWDYGPYTWPPATITDVFSGFGNSMGMPLPSALGDVKDPSCVPEAFMDTMVVNGTAYPTLTVGQKAYRFRILNACNDRYLNLQTYYTDNCGPFPGPTSTQIGIAPYASNITTQSTSPGTEVSMVKADGAIYGLTAGATNTVNLNAYPSGDAYFGNPVQLNEPNQAGIINPVTKTPYVGTPLYYPSDGTITSVNGTIGAGVSTVAVPFDGRVGGVPDPRQMGPQIVQIGSEGGLLPAPILLANNCVDYIYDRKQITFGNVRNYPLMTPNPSLPSQTLNYPHPGQNLHLGPAVRADVIIDFSQVPNGATIVLFNDAPAPQPGFDPRYDYYTGDPDYSNSITGMNMGGAPSTQPGFGPNTRTVMLFKVDQAVDTANTSLTGTTLLSALKGALPGYFTANQPAFVIAPGNYAPVQNITGMTDATGTREIPILNKTIAEDFDPVWGRMNAMLGTEQASTNSQGQQTFGFHFSDLATEVINPFNTPNFPPNSIATPVSDTTTYGTQIWKITHNGVDTHAVHFHLFNVQLINRVDWAGVIKPPDPNEAGWNETLRMNPLEDIYVALRPKIPTLAPTMGPLPNSVRPLDPTMPLGMTNAIFWNKLPAGAVIPNFPFTNPGPNPANPAVGQTMANNLTDLGWEYVWHCHLLGHEENDMMRTISVQVAPAAPTLLKGSNKKAAVSLSWTNNETIQTSFQFLVQRSTTSTFTQGTTTNLPLVNYPTVTDSDTLPAKGTYYYRVRAQNAYGYSAWSNVVLIKW